MKLQTRIHLSLLLLALGITGSPAIDRFVALDGGHVPPFNSWANAATNIQAAIDASSAGDTVWVTNGVYSTGGKVKAGDLTNRVALDKVIVVLSVNGPAVTIIQGAWDPTTTNGPLAVRCAWLTNGATLSGFTLQGGATRNSGDVLTLQSGGGIWCPSANATVINCRIAGNRAQQFGGGVYYGTLTQCVVSNNATLQPNGGGGGGVAYSTANSCRIMANSSSSGGGAYNAMLNNCAVVRNTASIGGGCDQSRINNCTVTWNSAAITAGIRWTGIDEAIRNSIVCNNYSSNGLLADYASGTKFSYTCTSPPLIPVGTGNIFLDPQLLGDDFHISPTSPCRTAGSPAYATGVDIDGQVWANPPSIGCDQWQPDPLVVVQPRPRPAAGTGQVRLVVDVVGQSPVYCTWHKDSIPLEDGSNYTNAHSTELLIRDFGVADAGAYQVVVSNAVGVVTSQVVQVTVHCVDAAGAAPAPPYTTLGIGVDHRPGRGGCFRAGRRGARNEWDLREWRQDEIRSVDQPCGGRPTAFAGECEWARAHDHSRALGSEHNKRSSRCTLCLAGRRCGT